MHGKGPLADGLAPLLLKQRSTHPSARPVSQTAFYIEGKDAFERAIREAVTWMRSRCLEIPTAAVGGDSFRVGAGAAFAAEAIGTHTDGLRLWAATLEDQREAQSHGRTWVTEITVGQREGLAAFGVRLTQLLRGLDAPYVSSRPNCVYDVLQHVTAKIDDRELRNEPSEINTISDTRELIDLLSNPNRRLPVLAFSMAENGQTSVDPDAVCRRLSGLAHFFVLSPSASWTLTTELTKSNSVFLGATRLYRPGFDSVDGNPFDHPLWTIRTAKADERRFYLNQISAQVTAASIRAFSGVSDFPRYDDVRQFVAQQAVVARKSAGANDAELVSLYAEENDRLRIQLDNLKSEHTAELQYASDELKRAEATRDEALAERRTLRDRIRGLELSVSQRGQLLSDQPLKSFDEIETWSERYLAGSIWIAPKAIRETEKNGQFDDPEAFGEALLMLRDYFVPMKREPGVERHAAYQARLQELRLTDLPCFGQSGMIKDFPEYKVDYQGERHWCEDHIKYGTGRDPRNFFRIYYFWHEDDQILIIGHMPTHLNNMRTN